jgi:formamidopyrimidine-DNA glycosylase
MPELPEVETTRRGIEPHLVGRRIVTVRVHDPRLRWPVRSDLAEWLQGRTIRSVDRRSKYLLIELDDGDRLIIHLGMSGSLRIVEPGTALRKHDHVEIELEGEDGNRLLRYHDPRRFGAILTDRSDIPHERLGKLGPEPLGPDFTADWLAERCRGRKQAIKQVIMNAEHVVGVGNIYANEALFLARINPYRPAGNCSKDELTTLVAAIRDVLGRAIEQGGTTLRDFVREDGQPGYFKQTLNVYDRADQPCPLCSTPIVRTVLGQRATYHCPVCQPA